MKASRVLTLEGFSTIFLRDTKLSSSFCCLEHWTHVLCLHKSRKGERGWMEWKTWKWELKESFFFFLTFTFDWLPSEERQGKGPSCSRDPCYNFPCLSLRTIKRKVRNGEVCYLKPIKNLTVVGMFPWNLLSIFKVSVQCNFFPH